MPDIGWMKKVIIGGKTIISYVDLVFSCNLLCAWYAPHFHTLSEPKFEQEPEPESQQITYPFVEFREISDDIRKLLASQAAKNNTNPEPTVLVEFDVLDEPKPKVIAKLVPWQEVTPPRPIDAKESLIEIIVDPSAEPTMKLLSSSSAMRVLLSLRLPDTYDSL